jgi:hypothetical protein
MKQGILLLIPGSTPQRNFPFQAGVGAWFILAALTAAFAGNPAPCSANPGSRQLDFWLGSWTVTYPGASGSSSSKVHLELDQCLVVENWDGGTGHSGKNMLAYSPDDDRWHGMFADNQGRVHVLEGKAQPGSAEFYGPSRGPNAEAVLNRVRIARVSANKVEQTWEKSTDKGVTWTKAFGGEYSRNRP